MNISINTNINKETFPRFSETLISLMKSEDGLYSSMNICPLAYNGYKETNEMIKYVIEEIELEISFRPQSVDILLDKINMLKKKINQ